MLRFKRSVRTPVLTRGKASRLRSKGHVFAPVAGAGTAHEIDKGSAAAGA